MSTAIDLKNTFQSNRNGTKNNDRAERERKRIKSSQIKWDCVRHILLSMTILQVENIKTKSSVKRENENYSEISDSIQIN